MIDPDEMAVAACHPAGLAAPLAGTGRGAIAARLRALAVERGIAVEADAGLATLLDRLDAESPIPAVAMAAAAEILALLPVGGGRP